MKLRPDTRAFEMGFNLGGSLWESLGYSLGNSLWDSLGYNLGHNLRYSLWSSLGYSLWKPTKEFKNAAAP